MTSEPNFTPDEQLLFDIETDRIADERPGTPPGPERRAQARAAAEALLRSQGITPLASEPVEAVEASSGSRWVLSIPPLASLAAADAVKAVIQWEAGDLRLLESPMRADLAIEVRINEQRQAEFSDGVLLVAIGKQAPLAVAPNKSPVFTRVHADDLLHGDALTIEWIPALRLRPEHTPALQRSLKNLRDPGSLDRYEALLRQAEEGNA